MPYSRSSSPFEQVGNYLRRSQTPVTLTIIGVAIVLFLVSFFTRGSLILFSYLMLATPITTKADVVALFTYPFLNPYYLTIIFASLWMFWVGGSLERSWGSGKFAAFFFAVTVVSGLGLELGTLITHEPSFIMGGLWIPVTALTVAWAAINPTQTVLAMGIVPIQARWIAIFEVGMIYFVYYEGAPVPGLFVLLGSLMAYLVVKFGIMTGMPSYRRPSGPDLRIISGGQSKRPLDDAGLRVSYNPVNRFRAWQQKRKLANLFKNGEFSDRDDDKRRR
jgi:membrane associated rhomboid family serine protease